MGQALGLLLANGVLREWYNVRVAMVKGHRGQQGRGGLRLTAYTSPGRGVQRHGRKSCAPNFGLDRVECSLGHEVLAECVGNLGWALSTHMSISEYMQ